MNKAIVWNSTNSDHTIPVSLVHSSRPSWYGGVWPPFDPANGAALIANASAFTNIPAGYRYIHGVDPSAGPVNNPPVASSSASPTTGPAPLAVTFSSNGSSDPEGTTLTYSWVFGDGNTSTTANPSHTYSTAGTYTAQLTVSDGTNNTSASAITIKVTQAGVNNPPVASASANVAGGIAPLAVTFSSAGSSDPDGTTLTYAWNFGDGSAVSTAANPSHTYSSSGVYSAVLTVSDGTNNVSATPIAISVANGASGLVAAYGFEEGSGTTLNDLSGNGNTGTATGATWTTGEFGNALSFNGSSSMVSINDAASLDLTSGMTLEAWVYPTSLSSTWSDVIFKSGDVYFLMGSTPTSQFPDVGGSFTANNSYGTAALAINTWSHLAGTYDGTTLKLYLNGNLVSSVSVSGTIPTSTGALSIGGDSGSGQYWTGKIDEVRVYNRALSATEVQTDMSNPVMGAVGSRPSPPAAPSGLRVVSQ